MDSINNAAAQFALRQRSNTSQPEPSVNNTLQFQPVLLPFHRLYTCNSEHLHTSLKIFVRGIDL